MANTLEPWKGVSFPFDGTIPGLLKYKGLNDLLKSAIENLLLTRLGERVMLPTFGTIVYDRVFDPNDDTLAGELLMNLKNAVATWDDRLEIITLNFERSEHLLKIKVQFRCPKDPLSKEINELEISIPNVGATTQKI